MTNKKRPASASAKTTGSDKGYKAKRPTTTSPTHSNISKRHNRDRSCVTPYGTTNSEQNHSCKYMSSYMRNNVWVNTKPSQPQNNEPMSRSRAQSIGNFRTHPDLVFYRVIPGTDQFLTGGRKKFPVQHS